MSHFWQVTSICLEFATALLAEATADRRGRWKSKDAAIALVLAIAVKGSTAAAGATSLSTLIDSTSFYAAHILPELQAGPRADCPVLTADAIKYATTFRRQMPADALTGLLPLLGGLLGSGSSVVRSYAANAVERFLAVKDGPTYRIPRAALSPLLSPLLEGLFGVLEEEESNAYAMRCTMRVLATAEPGALLPLTPMVLAKLTGLLTQLAANPSDPQFSHYLFEALASLVSTVCAAQPAAVPEFERHLFPSFQSVLTLDVTELTPYVFQVHMPAGLTGAGAGARTRAAAAVLPDSLLLTYFPVIGLSGLLCRRY